MKRYDNDTIKRQFEEIFSDEFDRYTIPEIIIEQNDETEVRIKIARMYEYVEYNFSHLMKMSEFFDTDMIDDDRYAYGGCETCDYGSSYEVTFVIKPRKK